MRVNWDHVRLNSFNVFAFRPWQVKQPRGRRSLLFPSIACLDSAWLQCSFQSGRFFSWRTDVRDAAASVACMAFQKFLFAVGSRWSSAAVQPRRQNRGHTEGEQTTRILVCTIASVVCVHAVWLFFFLFLQNSAAASLCAQPGFAPTTVRAHGSIYLRLCV